MGKLLRIPVRGGIGQIVPLAYDSNNALVMPSTVKKLLFDNLASGTQMKISKPSSKSSSSSSNLTWDDTNWNTYQFAIQAMTYDVGTGATVADSSGGSTTFPEITFVTNDTPLDTVAQWVNPTTVGIDFVTFAKDVYSWQNTPVLIVLCIGKDADGNPVGFAGMIGKLTSDFTVGPDGKKAEQYTITISPDAASTAGTGLLTALEATGFLLDGYPRLKTSPVNFPDMVAGDINNMLAGQVVLWAGS